MKNYSLLLLLAVALAGCGQAGPLYLPDAPPPVYVPKEKPKEEKLKEDKIKTEQKAPTKTESEKTK